MAERRNNTRIAFYTLGCKLNQAETESLAARFSQAGYHLVSPNDVADIYVANTCTVTHIADRKSRHWLRVARRRNPKAFIIATGCYAQRVPYNLAPIADLVLGNEGKEHLVDVVEGLRSTTGPSFCHSELCTLTGSEETKPLDNPRQRGLCEAPSPLNDNARVRSLIKVQDGCHGFCAYCIVPQVRTREHSVPAPQVIQEIKDRVAMDYKEIVLTGTKIGCYEDAPLGSNGESNAGLEDLVERILRDTSVRRLRLSSLQPQEISPRLLGLWQDDRLCRHLHLALQSGSDSVLHRMKRRYSLSNYQRALSLIRDAIPGVAITTDIMVGFPGETEREFEQSYLFCQQAGFANIHVFPFSPRPGTEAAQMPHQVDDRVKKERSHKMLQLAQQCWHSFCEQHLGQIMWVLWENEVSPGSSLYSGLTDNYIRVFTRSHRSLTNKMAQVRLVGLHRQGMWGELVGENSG